MNTISLRLPGVLTFSTGIGMNTESPVLADVTYPSSNSTRDLRRQLRAVMPDRAFEPNPWRALWFVPLVLAAATAMWVKKAVVDEEGHRAVAYDDGLWVADPGLARTVHKL